MVVPCLNLMSGLRSDSYLNPDPVGAKFLSKFGGRSNPSSTSGASPKAGTSKPSRQLVFTLLENMVTNDVCSREKLKSKSEASPG